MSQLEIPSQDLHDKLVRACRHLESEAGNIALEDLAAQAGLSASHFQRVFSSWIGLSPKRYRMAHRDARVRALLSRGVGVCEAFLQAGYETPSRFYQDIFHKLGMRPGQYKDRGAGADLRVSMGVCSLGQFLVGVSEHGVCAIDLGQDEHALLEGFQKRFSKANIMPATDNDDRLISQVIAMLDGLAPADFPLDIRGTVFQQQVWRALVKIPKGKTATYADIARAIGKPAAHRAVARACASNTLAVAIPCHRVVRTDGALSGYRWGVERKKVILNREASNPG